MIHMCILRILPSIPLYQPQEVTKMLCQALPTIVTQAQWLPLSATPTQAKAQMIK